MAALVTMKNPAHAQSKYYTVQPLFSSLSLALGHFSFCLPYFFHHFPTKSYVHFILQCDCELQLQERCSKISIFLLINVM